MIRRRGSGSQSGWTTQTLKRMSSRASPNLSSFHLSVYAEKLIQEQHTFIVIIFLAKTLQGHGTQLK